MPRFPMPECVYLLRCLFRKDNRCQRLQNINRPVLYLGCVCESMNKGKAFLSKEYMYQQYRSLHPHTLDYTRSKLTHPMSSSMALKKNLWQDLLSCPLKSASVTLAGLWLIFIRYGVSSSSTQYITLVSSMMDASRGYLLLPCFVPVTSWRLFVFSQATVLQLGQLLRCFYVCKKGTVQRLVQTIHYASSCQLPIYLFYITYTDGILTSHSLLLCRPLAPTMVSNSSSLTNKIRTLAPFTPSSTALTLPAYKLHSPRALWTMQLFGALLQSGSRQETLSCCNRNLLTCLLGAHSFSKHSQAHCISSIALCGQPQQYSAIIIIGVISPHVHLAGVFKIGNSCWQLELVLVCGREVLAGTMAYPNSPEVGLEGSSGLDHLIKNTGK